MEKLRMHITFVELFQYAIMTLSLLSYSDAFSSFRLRMYLLHLHMPCQFHQLSQLPLQVENILLITFSP